MDIPQFVYLFPLMGIFGCFLFGAIMNYVVHKNICIPTEGHTFSLLLEKMPRKRINELQ